jgi:hypothetical protein
VLKADVGSLTRLIRLYDQCDLDHIIFATRFVPASSVGNRGMIPVVSALIESHSLRTHDLEDAWGNRVDDADVTGATAQVSRHLPSNPVFVAGGSRRTRSRAAISMAGVQKGQGRPPSAGCSGGVQ